MSNDHYVSVTLFDRDGSTPIKRLHRAYAMQWLDENDAPGSFSFTIPSEDDPQVAVGRIVKFSYGLRSDQYRWAGVIETITERLTDDEDVIQVSGRGVRALLEGAVVYQGANETDQSRSFTDAYPGAIMRTFLSEAHARGTLTEITAGFTNTADSLGVAFNSDSDLTIDVEVGTSLADVADQHQEAVLDSVWVDADLVLHYAITRGTDTTTTNSPVIFRAQDNLVSFEKTVSGPVRNVTLVSFDEGEDVTEKASTVSGSLSTFGRREQFLDLNNVASETKAQRYANQLMKRSATASDGATVEVTDDGIKPYINYGIGDYLWVVAKNGSRTKYRVRALTVTADGDGNIRVVPELGTVQANLDDRLRKALKRLEGRNAKGDASSLSPPQSGLTSTVPSGTLVIGNPVGSEFVYQSPSLKADVIDITELSLSVVPSGIEDTANALGTGAGAVAVIGSSGSTNPAVISFDTNAGLISTSPLPITNANSVPTALVKWGNRIIVAPRTLSAGTSPEVAVFESGTPTIRTFTPPVTGLLCIGAGPSSDGADIIVVWASNSASSIGRISRYDMNGTELSFQTFATAGTNALRAYARVENGFVVIYHQYYINLTAYVENVYVTGADTTTPVQRFSGFPIYRDGASDALANAYLSLGTISPDGNCWIAGRLTNRAMYRINCNELTLNTYPNAFTGDEYSTFSVLSVNATKAVWLGNSRAPYVDQNGQTSSTSFTYYPTITNMVVQDGVVNSTRSQLDGAPEQRTAAYAWAGTYTSNGEVAFAARRDSSSSFTGTSGYRRFIRVAGP